MTKDSPAIWFVAHQDDETLFMGASIKQHVEAGRKNIVVLLTDGAASGVRNVYPSEEVFVQERDREFMAAVERLGAESRIRGDRMRDGTLSLRYAKRVIESFVERWPDASFKAMSPTDSHPDHAIIGEALKEVDPDDARYYIRTDHHDTVDGFFTPYYDLKDAFLAYTPVGWLSSRSLFEPQFEQSRNKVHK